MIVAGDIHNDNVFCIYVNHFKTYDQLFGRYICLFFFIVVYTF